MRETLDFMAIQTLRDFPDLVPVLRDSFESWLIRVFDRTKYDCRNYLSPNRRDFYKILMISGSSGTFTLGANHYEIQEPTLFFLHPNDIISWQHSSGNPGGYFVTFKREFISSNEGLRAATDRYRLFSDKSRCVVRLGNDALTRINAIWQLMIAEQDASQSLSHDALQAYIQLLMIEAQRDSKFFLPDEVAPEFKHIQKFFELLEEETSRINLSRPIRLRTAKEFADSLSLHPNYLNRLLKKRTGQNVSTHIKGRLLEESKALLLQTRWGLDEISFALGFSDPPNFTHFFKVNTGMAPTEFRKHFSSISPS